MCRTPWTWKDVFGLETLKNTGLQKLLGIYPSNLKQLKDQNVVFIVFCN